MIKTAVSSHPYSPLAQQLYARAITQSDLPDLLQSLPLFTRPLLDSAAAESIAALPVEPRRGWAMAAVMAVAAQQTDDIYLHAAAHFHLARAANGYYRPQQVAEAAARAHAAFSSLQDEGWMAACVWQANAIPWLRPNFAQVVTNLEAALPILQRKLPQFVANCRLSLSYAYLLTGKVSDAKVQVTAANIEFAAMNNQLGQAHCLYTQAAYQRRHSQFSAAMENLKHALTLYTAESATVFITIVQYNLAYLIGEQVGDATTAIEMLRAAATIFDDLDLPLWQAQCWNALGRFYNITGQSAFVGEMYKRAGQIYARYNIQGLQADSRLDYGLFLKAQGRYIESLDAFYKATVLYNAVGHTHLQLVSLMNQGHLYYLQGAYSQALRLLESTYEKMKMVAIAYRSASCATKLGQIWVDLSHFKHAQYYLDEAVTLYKQCQKEEGLPVLYMLQAEIAYYQTDTEMAAVWLQRALTLATTQNARPLIARAHHLLGQHLLIDSAWAMARRHLQTAVSYYKNMGMSTEHAASLLTLGQVYAAWKQPQAAQMAWHQALILTDLTDIRWQVEMELAHAANQRQAQAEALLHYRAGVTALSKQHRRLWQPTLAGAYLQRTVQYIDRAINFVFAAGDNETALQFIEASKAQTVARKLTEQEQDVTALPQAVQELVAEIHWLQDRLNEMGKGNKLTHLTASELRMELVQKVQMYQDEMDKLERAITPDTPFSHRQPFTLSRFQERAIQKLGTDWIALDYYITEAAIYMTIITPDEMNLHTIPLNRYLQNALHRCTQGQCRHPRIVQSLTRLGSALLPPALWARLTGDTMLIISPHRVLHQLPWAGLRSLATGRWLMETAVCTITPSLHSLMYLWQRPARLPIRQTAGLLVAIADFQERYPSLPAIVEERNGLQASLTPTPHLLVDEAATVAQLQLNRQQEIWETYSFLHIATHAFTDQVTGRLSGIALYDRDLWLDEWQQLSPLPPLVTFSACSGLRSRLYAGDEAVGLPTTCLAAGAQQIMGSLWSLLDVAASHFMQQFYAYWVLHGSAARALALVQRKIANDGVDMLHWAGYQCIGIP